MGEASAQLAGMTLNERLFDRGLFDRFDKVRAARDRDALRAILIEVEVSDIEWTIDQLLDSDRS